MTCLNGLQPPAIRCYNVQSWGAVGDGATNDAACIEAAIAAIPTGGGILFFPQTAHGYFIDTACITVPQGVMIAGIAGFGFFTQSRLMRPTTCPLIIAADGATGCVSATLGHIFDGPPGRSFASLSGVSQPNYSTAAVRGANFGEWLMLSSTPWSTITGDGTLQVIQNWSDDDMANVQPSNTIPPSSNNYVTLDPHAIMLPNGHIVCAYTAISPRSGTATNSSIQVALSTDGGRTWTIQATLTGTGSQRFAVPYLIRIRQQVPVANRVMMVFCCFGNNPNPSFFLTTYSDNEGASWSALTPVTPTATGPTTAGLLNDANRASMVEDGNGNIQVFYSRSLSTEPVSIWQVTCNNLGQSPGTPQEITTVPLATNCAGGTCYGVYPQVQRLRTDEFALYFTESNFNRGAIHFMTSPQAQIGTWVRDRTIWAIPSGLTTGFGLVVPIRKSSEGLELMFQANGQPFSIFHYGV